MRFFGDFSFWARSKNPRRFDIPGMGKIFGFISRGSTIFENLRFFEKLGIFENLEIFKNLEIFENLGIFENLRIFENLGIFNPVIFAKS